MSTALVLPLENGIFRVQPRPPAPANIDAADDCTRVRAARGTVCATCA